MEKRDTHLFMVLLISFYAYQVHMLTQAKKLAQENIWFQILDSIFTVKDTVACFSGDVWSEVTATDILAPAAVYWTSLFIFVSSWVQRYGIPWSLDHFPSSVILVTLDLFHSWWHCCWPGFALFSSNDIETGMMHAFDSTKHHIFKWEGKGQEKARETGGKKRKISWGDRIKGIERGPLENGAL